MIDYTDQVRELGKCKDEFNVIAKRLFDLSPESTEKTFSTQEMFALAARIILVREKISRVINNISATLQESDGDEEKIILDSLLGEIMDDDVLPGDIVSDIAEAKSNVFAFSVIARYQDMLLSVISYCNTGDPKFVQKKFRAISLRDLRF